MAKSGYCNNIAEGDPWRDEINSEGVFTLSGSWTCSGQMINTNTPGLPPPYFHTAYHCGIGASDSGSIVVYWNFQSPTCGRRGGARSPSTSRLAFRAK